MNTSNAKHSVACDMCSAEIGEHSIDPSKGHISVSLPSTSEYSNPNTVNNEPFDGKGYNTKQHHYCSESCMASHLALRAKARSKKMKSSKANEVDKFGNVEVDMGELDALAFVSHDSPPKGYPDTKEEYADPNNYKYPVNTKERVLAAWRYINKSHNQSGYSSGELASIKSRIKSAGKKFGLDLKDGE